MSETAGLQLAPGDATPLVRSGGGVSTRGDLRARADAIMARMAAAGVTRALVGSDDPADLIAAIDASARAGIDLYIAHTNLPNDVIADILDSFAIQMRLGDVEETRTITPAAEAPAGRIFMMTSGTTGRPKIASHTLDTLMARVRAGAQKLTPGGKWLLTYQPTGFAGIQVILTAAAARGLIANPAERNPAGFYEAAKQAGVTQISATPTFWRSFLMLVKPGELTLTQITMGGEAADQATLDRVKAAFPGARITHTYASTEAGVVYAVHDGREGFPAAWLEAPPAGVQLRIVEGFLQIRTPNAMRGYVTETAQPLHGDGWLSTADRAEIEGARVRVIGRDDSTINVGGSKVYPLMVETFLLKQAGVHEARVFGQPNPISGFLVAAEVVLEPGLDPTETRRQILAACREGLAQYQVPRVFKIVDAIAVRASGKKG